MAEHNILTDPELHEPKGISVASDNKFYASDGAGSGLWVGLYTSGSEYYHNSAADESLGTSFNIIENDGLGARTEKSLRLPSSGSMWDATNFYLDFSTAGLDYGDSVTLRLEIEATTSAANRVIDGKLEMGLGSGGSYSIPFQIANPDTASTVSALVTIPVFIVGAKELNNPAAIYAKSSGSGDSINLKGILAVTHLNRPRRL